MRSVIGLVCVSVVVGCSSDGINGADVEVCTSGTVYTVGSNVSGEVNASDCKDVQGNVGDVYTFGTGGNTGLQVTFSGSGFNPSIVVYKGSPANMSSAVEVADLGASDGSSFNLFLPAGSWFFMVTSENSSGGSYTLSTSTAVNTNGCARLNYMALGFTGEGQITGIDCATPGVEKYDAYHFYLRNGQSVAISATLAKSGGFILRTGSSSSPNLLTQPIATNTGGSVTWNYTAPSTAYYRLHINSAPSLVGNAGYVFGVH